ncbi:aldehyde dehydrogenase family protein [Actinomadura barringtoniae]|uniref:Aldehyde dehydrogenase family protein n=1 Tax=Actinomadura barringtoniae TaxID=1427535 RepID=A0A939P8I8_9ACTN|nr:aldehyde dehydrogenase family protein [Actinomadura barringtoniae]MBO2447866.1 aldehyde dehydrogenase family protein [Actinomadura barringtoniae]
MIERWNPARVHELAGRLPISDGAAVDEAVRRTGAAQRSWAALPPERRVEVLRLAAGVLEGSPHLPELLARETGKPLADCGGEIRFAATYLRWVADQAPRALADQEVDDAAGRLLLRRRPFGVVAAITPWNAPIILTMLKVGPALAAGNTVVVKPSPLAPLAITEVLERFPDDLVRTVNGHAGTGQALAGHPGVFRVAFTGGDAAAREIGATAARMLTSTVMELGGNDPAIILDDADLSDEAMDRLVMASFATSGQVCMAAKRLYVPRAMSDDFIAAYVAAARRTIVLGDPLDEGTTVGPVISAEAAARLDGLAGASLAAGGEAIELGTVRVDMSAGHFVRPSLLLGLPDDAPLVAREQFGPLVPVLVYDSEEEALARANAGELGLAASVWSADEDRAFRIARRLDAGFTFVNTHNRTGMALRAPFGGVRRSGHGREYGVEGILEYAQTCAVHAPAPFRAGGEGLAAGAYPPG